MGADIVGPLLTPDELAGKTVVNIGAGTGRIVNMIIAAGAARGYGLEPAPDAFAVLRRNTEPHGDGLDYLNIRGEELPPDLGAGYVLSIGVIHHIPEPDTTVRARFHALKPGGGCLFWLYGKEGDEAYLRFAVPLRKLTIRLPHFSHCGVRSDSELWAGWLHFPVPLRPPADARIHAETYGAARSR